MTEQRPMLAFILSIAVGLASVVFFFSAFFAPRLHRKDDFLWSGVGFFYALVLWLCAQRLTGAVLLGQVAASVLLLSFAWQTLKLRGMIANTVGMEEVKSFSVLDWLSGGLKKKPVVMPSKTKIEPPQPSPEVPVETKAAEEITPSQETKVIVEVPEAEEEIISTPTEAEEPSPELPVETELVKENVAETVAPADVPEQKVPPTTSPAPKPKQAGFFSRLFARPQPKPKPETIIEALAEADSQDSALEEWDEPDAVTDTSTEAITKSVIEELTRQEEIEIPQEQSVAEPPPDVEPEAIAVIEEAVVMATPIEEDGSHIIEEESPAPPAEESEQPEMEPETLTPEAEPVDDLDDLLDDDDSTGSDEAP